jgi:hypothetical protein
VARRQDLGEHRPRHPEEAEQLVIPRQRLEIHEHRAARVGRIRDVTAPGGASGEVPDHPRVGGAEERVASLGRLAQPVDVLEEPLELAAGEVRRRWQSGLAPDHVAAPVGIERARDGGGAGVLPHEGVGIGAAGMPVPHDRRLALVGHPDRVEIGGPQPGTSEGRADDRLGALPDLQRVVLDPASLGEDLLVLELVLAHLAPGMVEDHEPRARRALVDRTHEISHGSPCHRRLTHDVMGCGPCTPPRR